MRAFLRRLRTLAAAAALLCVMGTAAGAGESAMESLDGHMLEINRDFRRQSDLDLGPVYPFDEMLAGYDPSAHVVDDFFGNKLAFTVLLNFPLTSLPERLAHGETWSRRQWA